MPEGGVARRYLELVEKVAISIVNSYDDGSPVPESERLWPDIIQAIRNPQLPDKHNLRYQYTKYMEDAESRLCEYPLHSIVAQHFQKWVGEYGHSSITESNAEPCVFIDGCSRWLAWLLFDNPLVSGQEASTRALDFGKRPMCPEVFIPYSWEKEWKHKIDMTTPATVIETHEHTIHNYVPHPELKALHTDWMAIRNSELEWWKEDFRKSCEKCYPEHPSQEMLTALGVPETFIKGSTEYSSIQAVATAQCTACGGTGKKHPTFDPQAGAFRPAFDRSRWALPGTISTGCAFSYSLRAAARTLAMAYEYARESHNEPAISILDGIYAAFWAGAPGLAPLVLKKPKIPLLRPGEIYMEGPAEHVEVPIVDGKPVFPPPPFVSKDTPPALKKPKQSLAPLFEVTEAISKVELNSPWAAAGAHSYSMGVSTEKLNEVLTQMSVELTGKTPDEHAEAIDATIKAGGFEKPSGGLIGGFVSKEVADELKQNLEYRPPKPPESISDGAHQVSDLLLQATAKVESGGQRGELHYGGDLVSPEVIITEGTVPAVDKMIEKEGIKWSDEVHERRETAYGPPIQWTEKIKPLPVMEYDPDGQGPFGRALVGEPPPGFGGAPASGLLDAARAAVEKWDLPIVPGELIDHGDGTVTFGSVTMNKKDYEYLRGMSDEIFEHKGNRNNKEASTFDDFKKAPAFGQSQVTMRKEEFEEALAWSKSGSAFESEVWPHLIPEDVQYDDHDVRLTLTLTQSPDLMVERLRVKSRNTRRSYVDPRWNQLVRVNLVIQCSLAAATDWHRHRTCYPFTLGVVREAFGGSIFGVSIISTGENHSYVSKGGMGIVIDHHYKSEAGLESAVHKLRLRTGKLYDEFRAKGDYFRAMLCLPLGTRVSMSTSVGLRDFLYTHEMRSTVPGRNYEYEDQALQALKLLKKQLNNNFGKDAPLIIRALGLNLDDSELKKKQVE
jgi:hypothetical protein